MNKNHLLILILLCIHRSSAQPSPHHFNNQLIGNTRYVTLEEERTRKFCGNFWCENDSFYIFSKSSQYVGVDPCIDFKNFSVNHIEEVDHPDEREQFRGLQTIIQHKFLERMRKVVAAKIDPINDSRVVKVMKNTFQKCLQSPHLFRHLQAHKDIVKHLQTLGGSPYLNKHISFNPNLFNDDAIDYFYNKGFSITINNVTNEDDLWNEDKFELKKLFEVEPEFSLNLFLDIEVQRCENGRNKNEILCLTKPTRPTRYADDKYVLEVFKELFNNLHDSFRLPKYYKVYLINEIYKPTVNRLQTFLKNREEVKKSLNDSVVTKITIKDLQMKLANDFDIDWLKIFNNQLFEHSKVTENEEILIQDGGIEMLHELIENFLKTDKKTLADTFVSTYLYIHRYTIILRFNNQQNSMHYGIIKGFQRWNSCILYYLRLYAYPAHIFMYEQFRPIWDRTVGDFNRDLIDDQVDIPSSAEKFAQEAIDEFKMRFKVETDLKPSIAIEILNKLNSLKIVVSLQSNIFTVENLEEFYNELELKGDENLLKSAWKLEQFNRKILNDPLGSWRKQIDRMVYSYGQDWITYNIEDGNILYIPSIQLIYPWYHPLRPRFFNMATIFKEVIERINFGIQVYIEKKFNLPSINYTTVNDDFSQIGYEHYCNWLKNNTDLTIGANLLTHHQLYWMASAVTNYHRYHKIVPQKVNHNDRLRGEYFHAYYKHQKGFQEAFQCNITAEELSQFEDYRNKYDFNGLYE